MNEEIKQSLRESHDIELSKTDFKTLFTSYLKLLKESLENMNNLNYINHYFYFYMIKMSNLAAQMGNSNFMKMAFQKLIKNCQNIAEGNRTICFVDDLLKQNQNCFNSCEKKENEKIFNSCEKKEKETCFNSSEKKLSQFADFTSLVKNIKNPQKSSMINFDLLPCFVIGIFKN